MSSRAHPIATLFPLVLISLLAGMSFWLEQASRGGGESGDGKTRHDPDYFVDNFVLRRFDEGGVLLHTLVGNKMKHFPDDDSTVVQVPRLVYHRAPTTLVNAQQAQIDGKGERVRLFDNVLVVRGGKPGKPDSLLRTERLDAYPDDEIVMTDAAVTITQGMSTVQGTALRVDNRTAQYLLEGPVRGVFFRNGGMPAQRAAALPAMPSLETKQQQAKPKPQTKSVVKPAAKPKPQVKPRSQPKSKPTQSAVR